MSIRQQLSSAFEVDQHPLVLERATSSFQDDYRQEALVFRTKDGEAVPGIMTLPEAEGCYPAVLYLHAHGNNYAIGSDELIAGRPALAGPLGPELARSGIAALSINMPCFGGRRAVTESAAAKAALWHGRSLAGQMLGENASALDYLSRRADIDADRMGAFGLSMGATLGYWLAAVDQRLRCVAHLCCFADFAALMGEGAHDLHGIYLTVPGLLNLASNGQIAGLVAPRPQLIGIGDLDALTPPRAVDIAFGEARSTYLKHKALDQLELIRDPLTGHSETPEMRQTVRAFFQEHLVSGR